MVVEATLPRPFEALAAGPADGFATAGVFVVRGNVPDRLVQPYRIVFRSHSF